MQKISFETASFELLTSQIVGNLISHCQWFATTAGGFISYWLPMPDESEPEISVHENVVRSSNHPDYTTLHVQLCFKQSTNLIDSSKRIVNEVRVGYIYRLSMVTKALRAVF